MIKALFEGVLLGITLALLIGPSFFALIQTSIKNGFQSGLALATGIFLSDLTCVVLSYFGASQLFDNTKNKMIIGIIGGIILMIFGLVHLFQKKEVKETTIEIPKVNLPLAIIKGYFLNILNPFTIIFWLGAVTVVSSKYDLTYFNILVFLSGTLLTVFATDVLKAFIALKIRKILTPHTLLTINRIAGCILIVFGIILIYRVIPQF